MMFKNLSLARVVSLVSERLIPPLDRAEVVKVNVYEPSMIDERDADGVELRGAYWRTDDSGLPIRSTFRYAYDTVPREHMHGGPERLVKSVQTACVSILKALLPDPPPLFRIGTRAKLRMRKRGQVR